MFLRNVIDASGRSWQCKEEDGKATQGQRVSVICTTSTIDAHVRISVASDWNNMRDTGLAELIAAASPEPRARR